MAFEHLLPLATSIFLAAAAPGTTLDLPISNARNTKGVFHICVTAAERQFPDCSKDPAAIKRTVAATTRSVRIGGIPAGRYAVTLFHDENNNQRLDTMLGIPREGFGFSRNPAVRFGAPKFRQVEFQLVPGNNSQPIHLQYLL
ncbi:DUF2141 domain-containing protein [Sphingomonas piscis]|uniref:DUF2141 domain-containing protein n=1 Tax=Sphingomonas piscis TaxID=2714943 RepID=A0A6G7YSD6_9SPHN|nr:DUF2141 domain-containing protein [Sphingomonas piscis]QIK79653.1 DUF2141 domain-containing protein [Sphingomonas piscis]